MAKTFKDHNYHAIDATIIADSKSLISRATTFVCTFPRFILAEVNTHRMLSKNSASSRAIPFSKMKSDVVNNPFCPIAWQKDHSGMQGEEYLTGREEFDIPGLQGGTDIKMDGPQAAKEIWLRGRNEAIKYADMLNNVTGVTKQICNRMLEPYKWHTIIITGTDWENFLALRAHKDTEIHFEELAYKMLDALNNNDPKPLVPGEWHLPFGDQIDEDRIYNLTSQNGLDKKYVEEQTIKIATARCARVSYENFEGGDDYKKDIRLHDILKSQGHWSPMEHPLRAMSSKEIEEYKVCTPDEIFYGRCANFKGFIPYRKMFKKENRKDPRLHVL